MSDRHLNAEQARALRERHPGWPGWEQLKRWDRVGLRGETEQFIYGGVDRDDGDVCFWEVETGHVYGGINPADCYLLPTVDDLCDLLDWLGWDWALETEKKKRDHTIHRNCVVSPPEMGGWWGKAVATYEGEAAGVMPKNRLRLNAMYAALMEADVAVTYRGGGEDGARDE